MLNSNELIRLNEALDENVRFSGAFDDLLEDFFLRESVYDPDRFEY